MVKLYADEIVVELLKLTPGHVYITADGQKLFALANDKDVLEFTGPDFSTMTDEDVNNYIVEILKSIQL